MNELVQILHQLQAARFYGSLEVKFEAGVVTIIKKTESIKPGTGDHRDNRGQNDDARG